MKYLKFIPYLSIALLVVVVWYYRSSLISLENEVKALEAKQDGKSEIIEKIVEVEKVVYQDKIKYIKEYVYDANKSRCENGMSVIRMSSL